MITDNTYTAFTIFLGSGIEDLPAGRYYHYPSEKGMLHDLPVIPKMVKSGAYMLTLENYFKVKILNDYMILLLDEDRLGRENQTLIPQRRETLSATFNWQQTATSVYNI